MKSTSHDLSKDPNAIMVYKLPVTVSVYFSTTEGVCKTLEGEVHYDAGDAIVEGSHDDRWPIARARFYETYEPVPPTKYGEAGTYAKKLKLVWAIKLDSPLEVPIGDKGDVLRGKTGDWLVQYGPGDYGVVSAEIFKSTYQIQPKR